jgi:cyclopropane fatty-acyl-phospholipid synthase-like methyltransferase
VSDRAKAVVSSGYDAIANEFVDWSMKVVDPVRDRLFGEFVAQLQTGATVLDIGCGAGIPWTRALADRFDVTGIDISPRQIEAARRNVPSATFIEGDVSGASFEEESFDGVIAFYSIAHLPVDEHRPLFDRLARWLRPGGVLLASVPVAESAGWTGDWLATTMFFGSLGADAYRALLRDLRFEHLAVEEATAEEPDGPTRFLWVFVRRAQG